MMQGKLLKTITAVVLSSFIAELLFPLRALALTGGPVQVEFVGGASGEMVNPLTGEFSYSLPILDIPGTDGGGYSMSLNYHSGVKPEDEASWVGLGWDLNPGAIIRNKRGIPDDISSTSITYFQKAPVNVTIRGSAVGDYEVWNAESSRGAAQYDVGLRYNNYKGWALVGTLGLSVTNADGTMSLTPSASMDGNEFDFGFSANISPKNILGRVEQNDAKSNKADVLAGKQNQLTTMLARGINENNSGIGTSINSSPNSDFSMEGVNYYGENLNFKYTNLESGSNAKQGFTPGVSGAITVTNIGYKSGYRTRVGSGYLYSNNNADVFDYHVERNRSLKLDERGNRSLPIPYSDADYFSIVSSSISGGFRGYVDQNIAYSPMSQEGSMEVVNGSVEIEENTEPEWVQEGQYLRLNRTGAGTDIAYGNQKLELIRNKPVGLNTSPQLSRRYFRFGNEPSSIIQCNNNYTDFNSINRSRGIASGTQISYRLFRDIREEKLWNLSNTSPKGRGYLGYSKNANNSVPIAGKSDQIAEFSVVNDNGKRFTYGQPVYAWNEHTLGFGLYDTELGSEIAPNSNPYKVYSKYYEPLNIYKGTSKSLNVEEYKALYGQRDDYTYVSAYLLTDIVTPDYVDRTGNGLSEDDLGGYTKFSYRQSDDYKWRMPYNGFQYAKNGLADPRDDYASVVYGKKRLVYPKSVETKTHIAYFITNKTPLITAIGIQGSGTPRYDAYPADENEDLAGQISPSLPSNNPSEYLEQIVLYAKNSGGAPAKLLKRVLFKYDYSLMNGSGNNGVPNSAQAPNGQKGKLTLKKVWVETDGVVNAQISPYEFQYAYPEASQIPAKVQAKYPGLFTTPSGMVQNPNYSQSRGDAWGYHQTNTGQQEEYNKNWVDQTPDASFDPAAWHLKVIKLPSGGEIHVQYEQHDYSFVQDRQAMVMAKVTAEGASQKYYLDLDELGITTTNEKDQLVSMLKESFSPTGTKGEKIYFKFLYEPNLVSNLKEYVNGYAPVKDCGRESDGRVFIQFYDEDNKRPVDAAESYFKTHNVPDYGKDGMPSSLSWEDRNVGVIRALMSYYSSIPDQIEQWASSPAFKTYDYAGSYVRIPTIHAKKGGGVRVKRLLMLNPDGTMGATDNNAYAMVYGTEYIYKTYDNGRQQTISSGVATNEPSNDAENNSLICLVNDRKENYNYGIVAGDELVQFEGPLGMDLLPSASVNYSQVIIKDINEGPSGGGYTIYQYNTVKDFPTVEVVPTTRHDEHSSIPPWGGGGSTVNLLLFTLGIHTVNSTQDFSFILNNMHGTLDNITKYRGIFTESDLASNKYPPKVSSVKYSYYKGKEPIPVMEDINRPFRYKHLGIQQEKVREYRKLHDIFRQGSLQVDLTVESRLYPNSIPPLVLPVPLPGLMPYYFHNETTVTTEASNLVTSYPIFIKEIESNVDDVINTVTNIAFDPCTGEPNVVRTTDGYNTLQLGASTTPHNGAYYSYTVPARSKYPLIGGKSENEEFVINSTNDPLFQNISITATLSSTSTPQTGTLKFEYGSSNSPLDIDKQSRIAKIGTLLQPGDMIRLYKNTAPPDKPIQYSPAGLYYIKSVNSSTALSKTFDITQIKPSFPPIPSTTTATPVDEVVISKSTKANMIDSDIGTITVYGASEVEDKIKKALEYGYMLYEREQYMERLNSYVIDSPWGNYTANLTWDQNLTYQTLENNSLPQDIIYSLYQCPKLDGFSDDPRHIWYQYDYEEDNKPKIIKESPFRIVVERDNTQHVIRIKYQEFRNDAWSNGAVRTTEAGEYPIFDLPDEFPYNGTELFFVNDYGDPVFGTFPNLSTNSRNINWRFRGYVHLPNKLTESPCDANANPNPEYFTDAFKIDTYTPTKIDAFPPELNNYVLQASAITLSNANNYLSGSDGSLNTAPLFPDVSYETGAKRWGVKESYSFRSTTVPGSDPSLSTPTPGQRVYNNAGVYSQFSMFDWNSPMPPTGWIKGSTAEIYSPNGNVLQLRDITDIYSAKRYGNNGTLVECQASNAKYNDICFLSFEETGLPYTVSASCPTTSQGDEIGAIGHTGTHSLLLHPNCSLTLSNLVNPTSGNMYAIRYWVKDPDPSRWKQLLPTSFTSFMGVSSITSSRVIAQSGDWKLLEYVVLANGSSFSMTFTHPLLSGGESTFIYIDDIKIQPLSSAMSSLVYETNTLRLIASLSESHFATLYQYDQEGRLIRTVQETVGGYKTIAEATYNIPKESRYTENLYGTPIQNGGKGRNRKLLLPYSIPSSLHTPSRANSNSTEEKQHFDILQFDANPNKSDIKLFGKPADSSLKNMNIKQLLPKDIKMKNIIDSTAIKKSLNNSYKNIQNGSAIKDNTINYGFQDSVDSYRKQVKRAQKEVSVKVDTLKRSMKKDR